MTDKKDNGDLALERIKSITEQCCNDEYIEQIRQQERQRILEKLQELKKTQQKVLQIYASEPCPNENVVITQKEVIEAVDRFIRHLDRVIKQIEEVK
jgi:sugar-specific transcriptional regulator TrmB